MYRRTPVSPRGGFGLGGAGQAVGVGTGFDDVAAEGEPIDDRGAEPGSVKVLVQPENAIGTSTMPTGRIRGRRDAVN